MNEFAQHLRVAKLENRAARRMLDKYHPLGAGAAFAFALGVWWQGRCEGVLTFGNPISNNAVKTYGLRQCDVLELRKLWLSEVPPKNSESRALAVAARIIRKAYPQLKLLLTYCEGEESASAYKAAGWLPCEAHRYLREVRIGDKWLSVRDVNRKRLMGAVEEKKYEYRRKWILPLCDEIREMVQKSARAWSDEHRGTTGTETEKIPKAPLTGTGSSGRTRAKTQAKSPGSPPQQAAVSSSARKGRQSTRSTTARATPTGSSR